MERVKIRNVPGYVDTWNGRLITHLSSIDGRSIAVVISDEDQSWHVVPSDNVHPMYDACGCIAPCPDHLTPRQDAERDRAYWNDRYAEQVEEVDQGQD